MKAFAIFPTFELQLNDKRSRTCIELVSAIVVSALRQGGAHFHFVVDWRDPISPLGSPFSEDKAEPHIIQLADAAMLTDLVRRCVDPFDGVVSTIRSIATCRAVTFGHDGQAFLCLRHEDEPPVSSDPSLARIEERSDYLTQTDYFDGWVRETKDGI